MAEVVDRDVDVTTRLLRRMDEILGLAPLLEDDFSETTGDEVRGLLSPEPPAPRSTRE